MKKKKSGGAITIPILDQLRAVGCEVTPCGSRVTCKPTPVGADADFLVYAPSWLSGWRARRIIDAACFHREGGQKYFNPFASFISYRSYADVNLIYSRDEEFVERHRAATHVCRTLNLSVKSERIMLFQAVLYGKMAR